MSDLASAEGDRPIRARDHPGRPGFPQPPAADADRDHGEPAEACIRLQDRRMWLWLGGDALSSIGDQVTSFTLTFAAVPLLGPGAAGASLAAFGIPRLLLPLWAGALTDRISPRRLLLVCHLTRAVLVTGLAAAWSMHPSVLTLLVTVMLIGAGASLADPAAGALLPHTVRPASLTRAIATRSAANRTAIILGAPLAGLLLSTAGPATILLLDATTFAVAALGVAPMPPSVPRPGPDRPSVTREITAGLRYAARHRLIGTALTLLAVLNLTVCGPVELGLTQLAHTQHWPTWHLTMLLSAFGIGATTATIALAALASRIRRHGTWALTACATAAAGLLLTAATTHIGVLLLSTVLLGATAAAGTVLVAVIQHATPTDMTGRISGAITTTIWGTWAVSFAATGQLLHTLGPQVTLLLAAVTLATATLLCGRTGPELRCHQETPKDKQAGDGEEVPDLYIRERAVNADRAQFRHRDARPSEKSRRIRGMV